MAMKMAPPGTNVQSSTKNSQLDGASLRLFILYLRYKNDQHLTLHLWILHVA